MFRVASWVFGVLVAGAPVLGAAQERCTEPTSPQYLDRMARVRAAVEAEDYAVALGELRWAAERYEYALIEYSEARALHRLGRYAEAEARYNDFLRHFEGCEDPDGMRQTAQEYRALAIREQVATLTVPPRDVGAPVLAPPTLLPIGAEEAGVEDGGDSWPGWVALGLEGAALVAGVSYDLANGDRLDARDAAMAEGDGAALARANQRIEDGRAVDWAPYGSGVGLTAVGVVLLLALGGEDGTVQPAPGGVSWAY
jgi:tetratricopeptide (TPR) repeat protein